MSDTTTTAATEAAADTSSSDGTSGIDDLYKELHDDGYIDDRDEDTPDNAPTDGDPAEDEADEDEDAEGDDEDNDEDLIKLKVNGRTILKTLDEVKADAQKYAASEVKLETLKKEVETARAAVKTKDEMESSIKSFFGLLASGNFDKISDFVDEHMPSESQLAYRQGVVKMALNLYNEARMSPEEREAFQNKKELEKMRARVEHDRKTHEQAQFDQQVSRYSEQISVEVPKALVKVGLPDNNFTREQVIAVWRNAIEAGKDVSAEQVAAFVKNKLEEANVNFKTGQTNPAPKPVRPKATPQSANVKPRQARAPDFNDYIPYSQLRRK